MRKLQKSLQKNKSGKPEKSIDLTKVLSYGFNDETDKRMEIFERTLEQTGISIDVAIASKKKILESALDAQWLSSFHHSSSGARLTDNSMYMEDAMIDDSNAETLHSNAQDIFAILSKDFKISILPNGDHRLFQEQAARFYLWGENFSNRESRYILRHSRSLHFTVVKFLATIARLLLDSKSPCNYMPSCLLTTT